LTQYSRGRKFEWEVRDLLRSNGYVVIRSAGSKGSADLVAGKGGHSLFVQCKLGTKGIRSVDIRKLFELATAFGGRPVVAMKNRIKKGQRILFFEITDTLQTRFIGWIK
jgi:Holliday junction resolvase